MPPSDSPHPQVDDVSEYPPVQCDACESALRSNDDRMPSFLLLDQLTVPLIGCEDHLSQFTDICGYTSKNAASLVSHRPAGGIGCPSCHLAPYNPRHPVVPVEEGAVAVLACPEHQSAIVERFRTGLETQQRLSAPLNL